MKKYILLTTTAMLLSAITLNANAGSNSAELDIQAMFVKPIELIREQYLGFGMILADEGGKKVVVTTDGGVGEDTDATMMSTTTFTNYAGTSEAYGSFNEGIIRLKGFMQEDYDNVSFLTPNDENLSMIFSANLTNTPVELRSNIDSTLCGTVTNFNTKFTVEGNDAILHIGGTLNTANLNGQTRTVFCRGYTTVTIVINEENFAAYQNADVNGNL